MGIETDTPEHEWPLRQAALILEKTGANFFGTFASHVDNKGTVTTLLITEGLTAAETYKCAYVAMHNIAVRAMEAVAPGVELPQNPVRVVQLMATHALLKERTL